MLRELFVILRMNSGDTEDRLKKINKEVDKASDEFKRFGVRGQASYNEIAKAAGISNEQMEKLIQKTKQDMKLDEQFRSAAKSAGLTDAEINKVKNSIDRAKESTASWKGVMSGLAAAGITAFAGMFVASGVKMAAETENMSIQFETLMKDANLAKITLQKLKEFATETNFESDQINKAGRQLLAVGINADELIPKLRMIGDVANGSGKDFNELATIFAKNKSSNFIQGEDLNQLIEAGIPILDEFGKMFGKTAIQVKEMGSKNQIEFKHLEQAFKNLTTQGGLYDNMTAKLSKTSLGMWSTLSDKVKDVGKSIGTGILSLSRPLLEFFTQGEQAGMRLNMALGVLGLLISVVLVKATMAWAASLDVVTTSAIRAYAALLWPAVLIAAKLTVLYLILEDIWVFFEYGPDASETYFADLLRWVGLSEDELKKLSDGFQWLKEVFSQAWNKITELLKDPTFKIVFGAIAIGIALLVAPMALLGAAIFALKVGLFLLITVGIATLIAKWDSMVAWMGDKWERFKLKVKTIATGLAIEVVKNFIKIKDFFSDVFSEKSLASIKDGFKKVFTELMNYITNLPFVQNLVNQFYSLKDRIANVFSGMWQSLKATFQNLLPTETINTIIDGMNWISAKLNEFSSGKIASGLGISPLNLPVIPRIEARALGGPIEAGMPYLVGERGPELVVPRNNGTVIPNDRLQGGGSGTNNTFNFTVHINSANPEYDAQSLYEKMMELVNSESARSKQRYEMGIG